MVDLNQTMDAKAWASEFAKQFLQDKHGTDCQCGENNRGYIDEATMLTWFSSALLSGYNHARDAHLGKRMR